MVSPLRGPRRGRRVTLNWMPSMVVLVMGGGRLVRFNCSTERGQRCSSNPLAIPFRKEVPMPAQNLGSCTNSAMAPNQSAGVASANCCRSAGVRSSTIRFHSFSSSVSRLGRVIGSVAWLLVNCSTGRGQTPRGLPSSPPSLPHRLRGRSTVPRQQSAPASVRFAHRSCNGRILPKGSHWFRSTLHMP